MTATSIASSVFVPSTAVVRFENQFIPNEFFQNRAGLWVSDDFRTLVVAKAGPTEAGKIFTVKPQTLGRDATDVEIEDPVIGMGPNHLFDETAVAAIVAGLIMKQANGEAGALLNNGYANLLYLSSCVVDVGRRVAGRRWYVDAWKRGGDRWRAGIQVFSPGN